MNKEKPWVVLKFGGSSVSSSENWKNIKDEVTKRLEKGHRVCLVHSALKGVSNKLEELAAASDETVMSDIIDSLKDQHYRLGDALGVDAEPLLEPYFQELENLARGISLLGETSHRTHARMLAMGELLSTTLGSAYLNDQALDARWMDARTLLQSISRPNINEQTAILSAVCDIKPQPELQKELAQVGDVIITQGFIASDSLGKTVLLGRGGSDVSGAYFAAKLQAEQLEIWTDVPGLFSANPNQIASARLLKKLSYEEAQEIATNGASVLHPRCILPARKHGIPIHVRCTQRPELSGTVISGDVSGEKGLVKAIALRSDIKLISMDSLGMWQQVGFLADAFEVFKQYGLSIDLISTSESNVTVSLDPSLNGHFNQIREEFIAALQKLCNVKVIDSVAAVSLLGRNIRTILHRLGESFEVFKEQKIYLVTQAANDLNFTFVVPADQAERLLRQLHEEVISGDNNSGSLGQTWDELMEQQHTQGESFTPWWKTKREELLSLSREKGSLYVYDGDEIATNISRIRQLDAVDTYFYAMKANAQEQVLRTFYEAGLGFECVSIGEVEHVLELFPDIDRKRILFTPNFAQRKEYEQGFKAGVNVTLDNIFPLQQWSDLFREQSFFLRIDPGHGKGHHKHVKTGGIHSKFGIPRFELEEVKDIVDSIGARVVGLHAHTGSGIKDASLWKETALILHEVAEQFGTVEILDLGGGFGIKENETQNALNLERVNKTLQDFTQAYPQYQLWVEPGRFLIATAGVLVSPVTQLKGKGEVRYVGIDTGMNSFIRPALYGASHTIVNLDKLDQPIRQTVNIVGPICESGDKLGIDRRFPQTEEGDIILVANAGAYGHVMSSHYNMRPPAPEVFLEG